MSIHSASKSDNMKLVKPIDIFEEGLSVGADASVVPGWDSDGHAFFFYDTYSIYSVLLFTRGHEAQAIAGSEGRRLS